jgi:hypothetical protein
MPKLLFNFVGTDMLNLFLEGKLFFMKILTFGPGLMPQ